MRLSLRVRNTLATSDRNEGSVRGSGDVKELKKNSGRSTTVSENDHLLTFVAKVLLPKFAFLFEFLAPEQDAVHLTSLTGSRVERVLSLDRLGCLTLVVRHI